MGARGKSKGLSEESLIEMMRGIRRIERDKVISNAIWGTYVCQDMMRQITWDLGGLAEIFKHKLAFRALIAGRAVQASSVGWIPGLAPDQQAAALARPSALLASQRDQQLAGSVRNLLKIGQSSAE